MKKYPIVTLGSPYGIGYEIFLLSLNNSIFTDGPIFAVGSKSILDAFIELLEIECTYVPMKADHLESRTIDTVKTGQNDFILIDIDTTRLPLAPIQSIDPVLDGKIAYASIVLAARLVAKGLFSSIVTLPVSKENVNKVDKNFKGHTEFLMELWNEDQVFMTFISKKINVFLLTTHIPLTAVPAALSPEYVENAINQADKLVKKLNLCKPICFLGLNPHAGESGLLGKEEVWIDNIIKQKQSESINIIGPVPADTAFTPAGLEKYSLFIANYHDQGLIPFKMLAFDDGVNLSFGMKFIRTSVDHGTARDLIGKKTACTESFISAYKLALKLSE